MTAVETDTEALSIGKVAKRTGLSVHALRLYEREGLLIGPVQRSARGQRQYTAVDVEWLLICVKLRESGMPLADLKRFAKLVRRGPGNEAERLRLLDSHRQRVESQIQVLEESRSVIASKVDAYGDANGLWDPTGTQGMKTQYPDSA